MNVMKYITIQGVLRVKRPRIGYVYQGKITIGELALGLINGDIKYAPKYQRGLKQSDENVIDESMLLPITDDRLLIDKKRADAMAVKYLMALNGQDSALYAPEVIWNARDLPEVTAPTYKEKDRTLIIHTGLSIPDSAHRHYAYYRLAQWHKNPSTVPDEVVITEDGDSKTQGEIQEWLEIFDPYDSEESNIIVQIFNLSPEDEGKLFDEFNAERKAPSKAASIDMHISKTSSRRFVGKLMKACPVFGPDEVETRSTTIGSVSRKLTMISTLEAAVKPFDRRLLALEDKTGEYEDLVNFTGKFWEEWSHHYKEFEPTASGNARKALRQVSFASSNIIFFPMFRIAMALWEKYNLNNVNWETESEWKDALAKLAGDTEVEDPDDPSRTFRIPVMARDCTEPATTGNPEWYGMILVQKFGADGVHIGWSLSSTRQTRDAAYHYLVKKSGIVLQ